MKISINKIKKWRSEKNLYKLIDATRNEDSEIRIASILSIAAIGDKACLQYMAALLPVERDIFVRNEIQKCINILNISNYNSLEIKEMKFDKEIMQLVPNSQGA